MKMWLCSVLAVSTLSGCASLMGPSAAEISRLPVVSYGEKSPDGEYVLRYPANTNLPVDVRIDGSLLSQTAQTQLNVQVKQDVYVYRDQVSLDGKEWAASQTRIGGLFRVQIPGYKHVPGERYPVPDAQQPGELGATFNLK